MKRIIISLLILSVPVALGSCAEDKTKEDGGKGGGGGGTPAGFVSLADYSSYRNGQDWAPAMARALSENDRVFVPAGTYPCGEMSVPGGKQIRGAGASTVFAPLGMRLFSLVGTIGNEVAIVADIVDFSSTILLTGPAGLAPGDDIFIRGQRNSMLREGTAGVHYDVDWVLGRTRESNCFYSEMDVVASVTGAKITTASNRIFPGYFKDNSREPSMGAGFLMRQATTVSKMTMVKEVTLSDFAITGTETCYQPILMTYCKDCSIERVTFTTSVESYDPNGTPNLSIVNATYVWNTKVSDCEAIFTPAMLARLDAKDKLYVNFSNYNIFKMISCINSGFENCRANGGSHAFSITRSSTASGRGGATSIDCYIRNCVASNCIWSGVTVQQACYNTDLTGNTVTDSGQGVITAGRNTRIINNTVSTAIPYGANYYYTHISRGGTFGIGLNEGYACGTEIRGNRVTGFYTGIIVVDGYEDKNCFEEGNIIVADNIVTDCLRGFGIYKNTFCTNMGRLDLNIEVSNNTFTRSGPLTVSVNGTATDTYGVYLPKAVSGVRISGNAFNSFAYGVWMNDFVDYISVKNNSFTTGTYGLWLKTISPAPDYKIRLSHSGNNFTGVTTQTAGLGQSCVEPY